jgi:hypothetical protein
MNTNSNVFFFMVLYGSGSEDVVPSGCADDAGTQLGGVISEGL